MEIFHLELQYLGEVRSSLYLFVRKKGLFMLIFHISSYVHPDSFKVLLRKTALGDCTEYQKGVKLKKILSTGASSKHTQ